MKTQDNINLEERNQKALKNFILWRREKQEEEEEEEIDLSAVNLLLSD
jgi:hypothetical protein